MNLSRKIEIVRDGIRSISTHTDQDGAVRAAALDRIIEFATAEKGRIEAELAAKIEAELAP